MGTGVRGMIGEVAVRNVGVEVTEGPGNVTTPHHNSAVVIVEDILTRKHVAMNRNAQWTEIGDLGPFTPLAPARAEGDENAGPGNVTTPDPGTED